MKPILWGAILGLALAAVFFLVIPAFAATPVAVCGSNEDMHKVLFQNHRERVIGKGLAGTQGRGLLELLASPDGKTFSVLLVLPDGQACIIAAGQDWERVIQGERI